MYGVPGKLEKLEKLVHLNAWPEQRLPFVRRAVSFVD